MFESIKFILNKIFRFWCPLCGSWLHTEWISKSYYIFAHIPFDRLYCPKCGWREGYGPVYHKQCGKIAFFLDEKVDPCVIRFHKNISTESEPKGIQSYIIYPDGEIPTNRHLVHCHACGDQIRVIDLRKGIALSTLSKV